LFIYLVLLNGRLDFLEQTNQIIHKNATFVLERDNLSWSVLFD